VSCDNGKEVEKSNAMTQESKGGDQAKERLIGGGMELDLEASVEPTTRKQGEKNV
jgi:hypothetical protein